MLCLSKALSPIILRRLYGSVEIKNGRAKPVRRLIDALCSSTSKVGAIKRLALGRESDHHTSSPTPSRNNKIMAIANQCHPQELLLYLHYPRVLLASKFQVAHLQRLVICGGWDSRDLMSAFEDLLIRVAVQAPEATVALAGAAVQVLAFLDPALIEDARGLQHLSLLDCSGCRRYDLAGFDRDLAMAQAVYNILFRSHGKRMRHLDIEGLQYHYLLEGNFQLSAMNQFNNLESLVIWFRLARPSWCEVVQDLPSIPSLKRIVMKESIEATTFEPFLLEVWEEILTNKNNLPRLEQLDLASFKLRASIDAMDQDDAVTELLEWEIGLKRLENVCSRRNIALIF